MSFQLTGFTLFFRQIHFSRFVLLTLILVLAVLTLSGLTWKNFLEKNNLILERTQLLVDQERLASQTENLKKEIDDLRNEDLREANEDLKKTIKEVEVTFKTYAVLVEKIADARSGGIKTADLEKEEAEIVKMLSDLNYASASAKLTSVGQKIDSLLAQKEASLMEKVASSVPTSQDLPTSDYRRQMVQTDRGAFLVDIVATQVGTARVIVDTASDEDCPDNCPVLPLATYVQRNGGFAGINGSYFCPAEYPSCAGRANSYDTLAMNSRTKKYFNSENNKFSTVPLVAFDGGGSPIFKMQTLEWGRDAGVQAVLANHPMLVLGGNIVVPGGLSEKQQVKSNRSVVASKGNLIFLMVVHSASVSDAAVVVKALGVDNALNLDSGGSTALYFGGSYKVGPGRNLPNAIILAR